MAGYGDDFLYRLLRDDEFPLTDGIMAKRPSRDKEPSYHIRQCSSEYKACHWISTCATMEGLKKMKELKRRKLKDDEGDNDTCLKYVVIDRSELETYAEKCEEAYNDPLFEVFQDQIVRTVPFREKTGRILDFTYSNVMDEYLPKKDQSDKKYQIQRNYAAKYEEVLVERFIPPHCCIKVIHGENSCDNPFYLNDGTGEKELFLFHEWNAKCQTEISSVTSLMRDTHIGE
ncbi:uncharacterized protein LOC132743115 [Ruditapes philippinarum]|uniref:uncharacterized protein LOC132743115 n=1 Tax=Ruditapes philippinarum TaxID=129788 RepID=UPI00295A666F|nr:uncharacterized protein LOC132743115 [Ruditapes philippinarum]